MSLEPIKKIAFWIIFLIFMAILFLTTSATKTSIVFRVIVVALIAFIASKFRLEEHLSFFSILLVSATAVICSAILAASVIQFWVFATMYIAVFFTSVPIWNKNLLGI